MMIMVKQQRKNARRAHSGEGERSCSGLLAQRVQGAGSGVMTCSKHLISIMFSFTRGQSCDDSSPHPDAAAGIGTEIFNRSRVASWRGTPQHRVFALSTAKSQRSGVRSVIGSLFPFETLIERKAAETPTSDGW